MLKFVEIHCIVGFYRQLRSLSKVHNRVDFFMETPFSPYKNSWIAQNVLTVPIRRKMFYNKNMNFPRFFILSPNQDISWKLNLFSEYK